MFCPCPVHWHCLLIPLLSRRSTVSIASPLEEQMLFITASLLMLTSKPDIYEGTIQGGDGVPLNTCSPWYGQENMSFSASMTSSCLYLKWQICLFLWWDGSSSEALLFARQERQQLTGGCTEACGGLSRMESSEQRCILQGSLLFLLAKT
ncbi:hypothetical protein CFC21_100242 [Triticum aestivum]|uniref:Uncharacterized protein n=2 Tax=Triticum aestivum TaxID=4565 RepID=A0A9R1N2Q9_WHEAT|nr:hypothetical protein CFC21_100242 [Triticum aestivum]